MPHRRRTPRTRIAGTLAAWLVMPVALLLFLQWPLRDVVLDEAMELTGGLAGLFVAATTFTLVFRGFGPDRFLSDWVTAAPGGAPGVALPVLALIAASALVLDAFEIVLVIVPLLLPDC